MAQLKLNIETLFPQFTLCNVVRQNAYKKSMIVKRSGHNYMLRLFNIEGIQKDKVQSIVKLLNKLSRYRNPHVMKFYEATYDQDITYFGIISEFIEHQYVCPIQEKAIWTILQQIGSALSLFHPKRPHAKIQLSNIFCSNDKTILGEMNVLFYLHQINYQDIYLLAPEFIRSGVYDIRSDIWMLGYLLYQFMFKEPPFNATNISVLHKKILKGFQVPFNPNYSINLNNLLKLMLCYDPELRPTIDQVLNFSAMAETTTEEININRIIPKFKLERVVLHKKKTEKAEKPVQNVVYLEQDMYKQPYFPPSKVKKQKPKSPKNISKQIFSVFDLNVQPQNKTGYSLQLPKVLQYQFSKQKLKSETRKDTPVRLLEETQRMLESFEPMSQHFSLPKRISLQSNRTQKLFQQFDKIKKNQSQKVFQYN